MSTLARFFLLLWLAVLVLTAQSVWTEGTIIQGTVGVAIGSVAAPAPTCGENEALVGDGCDPLDAGVLLVLGSLR